MEEREQEAAARATRRPARARARPLPSRPRARLWLAQLPRPVLSASAFLALPSSLASHPAAVRASRLDPPTTRSLSTSPPSSPARALPRARFLSRSSQACPACAASRLRLAAPLRTRASPRIEPKPLATPPSPRAQPDLLKHEPLVLLERASLPPHHLFGRSSALLCSLGTVSRLGFAAERRTLEGERQCAARAFPRLRCRNSLALGILASLPHCITARSPLRRSSRLDACRQAAGPTGRAEQGRGRRRLRELGSLAGALVFPSASLHAFTITLSSCCRKSVNAAPLST